MLKQDLDTRCSYYNYDGKNEHFSFRIFLLHSSSNYFESLKKNSRLIMRALQFCLVKLHFLLKINNFPRMNPLLAAIDLLEALPRVIHDRDKKIHCSIQTERTIFLLYPM